MYVSRISLSLSMRMIDGSSLRGTPGALDFLGGLRLQR